MRVLVTGGREFRDREWLYAGLNLLHETVGGITEIIEGGAPGADTLAANWSYWRLHKASTCVKADWLHHGRAAGMIRNAQMADMRPDVVLACPGGKGTANMVEVAKKKGLRVIRLEKMPVTKKGGPSGPPPEVIVDAA